MLFCFLVILFTLGLQIWLCINTWLSKNKMSIKWICLKWSKWTQNSNVNQTNSDNTCKRMVVAHTGVVTQAHFITSGYRIFSGLWMTRIVAVGVHFFFFWNPFFFLIFFYNYFPYHVWIHFNCTYVNFLTLRILDENLNCNWFQKFQRIS